MADTVEQVWIDADRGTVASSLVGSPVPAATRTSAARLTEDAHDLRNRARILHSDVGETHRRTYRHEWSVLTQQRAAEDPVALLAELADLGFAWRDVARLVGVSVPAVQKWRRGERLSGENRFRLASLVAACDLVAGHYLVEDVATWFETRIHGGAPVTPVDLWASGRQATFFDYASRHLTPEQALDEFDERWRERYRSEFEPFRDEDGATGVRLRGG